MSENTESTTVTTEASDVFYPETSGTQEMPEENQVIGQDEESAPSEEIEPASDEGETVSESEPEEKTGSEKDSEARATETAKKQAIELRALKRELKQLKESQSKAPASATPEVVEPKAPTLEECDWDTEVYTQKQAEYLAARDAYVVARDRQAREAKAAQEAKDKQTEENTKEWMKRQAETLKRNPDYSFKDAYEEVAPSPLVDGFLIQCEIGPDVLHYLHKHPDAAEGLAKISNPYKQVEKLIEIRNTLQNQIRGIKPKAATVTPIKSVPGNSAGIPRKKSAEDLLYG